MVPSHPGAVKKDGQLMYAILQVCAYDAAPSKPTVVGRGLADFFSTHAIDAHLQRCYYYCRLMWGSENAWTMVLLGSRVSSKNGIARDA